METNEELTVEINPGVLHACVQIIDLAAGKGVFVGGDLTAVGAIRAQLVEVVNANAAAHGNVPPLSANDEQPSEEETIN